MIQIESWKVKVLWKKSIGNSSKQLHKVEEFVSWEPEGRYCSSKMFHWEPEGRYRCTKSMAIAPFWFSTEHLWSAIAPFWLSADELLSKSINAVLERTEQCKKKRFQIGSQKVPSLVTTVAPLLVLLSTILMKEKSAQ